MTRKPADGSTPVETLEELRDELDEAIESLHETLNRYERLGDYFNKVFENNLGKAISFAEVALDELRDDIDSIDEDDVLGEDEE